MVDRKFQARYLGYTLGNPAACSGQKSSSELILTGRGLLASILLLTDGSNDATLTVYDNTAASGKIVRKFKVLASEEFGGTILPYPIYMENGIYVAVSGTGATYIIDYINRTL